MTEEKEEGRKEVRQEEKGCEGEKKKRLGKTRKRTNLGPRQLVTSSSKQRAAEAKKDEKLGDERRAYRLRSSRAQKCQDHNTGKRIWVSIAPFVSE